MPLVKCPDCDSQVSDIAPVCPHCGRPMAATVIEATSKQFKAQAVGGCLVFIIGIVIAALSSSVSSNESVGTIGGIITIVGMLIYLNARISAWWHHG